MSVAGPNAIPPLAWWVRITSPAVAITAAIATLAACGSIGCANARREVFPTISPPIIWPPPPDTPRIQYVGALTGDQNFNRRDDAAGSGALNALRAVFEGPRPPTEFVSPIAVAVRGDRVAVADPSAIGGAAVYVLDIAAMTFEAWRTPDEKGFAWPIDVTWCGERLAVADAKRGEVLVLDASGRKIAAIGGNTIPPVAGAAGGAFRPTALAWDAAKGESYVLDGGGQTCAVFDENGVLRRRLGAFGEAAGQFNRPTGVALGTVEGRRAVVVADAMNFRVQVFDLDGAAFATTIRPSPDPSIAGREVADASFAGKGIASENAAEATANVPCLPEAALAADRASPALAADQTPAARVFGRRGDAAGDFSLPRDVALDSEGHIYVLDSQFENVQVFDGQGRLLMAFGEEGGGPGQFNLPSGITIDERDRIWVADTYNRRVQVFQYLRERGP